MASDIPHLADIDFDDLSGLPTTDLPALVPTADENYAMDAEDSLPALENAPPLTLGDDLINDSPMPSPAGGCVGAWFEAFWAQLEAKEREGRSERCSTEFYMLIILCRLIKLGVNNETKCMMGHVRALGYGDLRGVITICEYLECGDTGSALHLLKALNFSSTCRKLADVLYERVIVDVLRSIHMSYVSVDVDTLKNVTGSSNLTELLEILDTRCGWVIGSNGFIRPSMTLLLQSSIDLCEESEFGHLPGLMTVRVNHSKDGDGDNEDDEEEKQEREEDERREKSRAVEEDKLNSACCKRFSNGQDDHFGIRAMEEVARIAEFVHSEH